MVVNGTGSLAVLVILLLVALTFQAKVEGKLQETFKLDKEINVSRIIDHSEGEDGEPKKAKLGQFPWQVLILTEKIQGEFICGGSIIQLEWILTAAHCIAEKIKDNNGYKIEAKGAKIIAGIINRGEHNYGNHKEIRKFEGEELKAEGEKRCVFIHEDYNTKKTLNYDIALIKLKEPLRLSNYVKPILLASDIKTGRKLTDSGWGYMNYDVYKPYQTGKFWNIVQCPAVKVYKASLEDCKRDCAINKDCHVIAYKITVTGCILQKCIGDNIPEPKGKKENIIGYTSYGKEEYLGKKGEYWTPGQCHSLFKRQETLGTCKKLCDEHKKCNVFRYKAKRSLCQLQHCNGDIPNPRGTSTAWTGYKLYTKYEPHQSDKTWEHDICENDKKYPDLITDVSLEKCKHMCTSSDSCNAFSFEDHLGYGVIVNCKLLNCGVNIPEPNLKKDGYLGYRRHKGPSPAILRFVNGLKLKSEEECKSLFSNEKISESMSCHETIKKSFYKGDSGGPITFSVAETNPPIEVQIGINSWVIDSVKYAAVFTNVAKLRPWIFATMGVHTIPPPPSCPTTCSRTFLTRSGLEKCVTETCPDDGDFFTPTGSKQCFKVLDKSAMWEQAYEDCNSFGLELAEPIDSVQLRKSLVERLETDDPGFYVWLGACQFEPNKMTWKNSKTEITAEDPLWYPGQPDHSEGCLLLLSSKEYLEEEPDKPFWNVLPTYEFQPLCELILE